MDPLFSAIAPALLTILVTYVFNLNARIIANLQKLVDTRAQLQKAEQTRILDEEIKRALQTLRVTQIARQFQNILLIVFYVQIVAYLVLMMLGITFESHRTDFFVIGYIFGATGSVTGLIGLFYTLNTLRKKERVPNNSRD